MSDFSEVSEIVAPAAELVEPAVEAGAAEGAAAEASAVEAVVAEVAGEVVADADPQLAAASVDPAGEAAGTPGVQADHAAGDAKGPVVRMLAVGQEVQGVVKRVSEFGAFVDIGVGRDGLVHISELSVRRVNKVSDVLHDGQVVTLWIKKLDRDKNRISLTMIPPETKTLRDLQKDDLVQGTVTRIVTYGAFVDIGVGRDALLHVREMSDRFVAKPEDVVKVGDQIEAKIIEIQRRRGRIDLSMKGLHPEPEPAPEPEPIRQPAPPMSAQYPGQHGAQHSAKHAVQEEEPEESYEEAEALSTMEAAFKKAMESSGGSYRMGGSSDKKAKSKYRDKTRAEHEEIYSRTLKQGK